MLQTSTTMHKKTQNSGLAQPPIVFLDAVWLGFISYGAVVRWWLGLEPEKASTKLRVQEE